MGKQQQSREKENNVIHEVQSRRKAVSYKKYGQNNFVILISFPSYLNLFSFLL